MKKISILLADDHLIFTSALAEVINREIDMEVRMTVSGGKSVLQQLQSTAYDVVILDINMKDMDGIATLQKIKQLHKEIKVIMLTTYDEAHLISKVQKEGADGYLIKSTDIDNLLDTIRVVSRGGICFPKLSNTLKTDAEQFTRQFFLTPREKEIVALIGQHKTNHEIAETLFLSIYTVETHRKNIMDKLGIKKPGMLLTYIHEHKLANTDEAH